MYDKILGEQDLKQFEGMKTKRRIFLFNIGKFIKKLSKISWLVSKTFCTQIKNILIQPHGQNYC